VTFRADIVFALLAATGTIGAAVADPNAPTKKFEDRSLGIAFKYPERFTLGRYKGPDLGPSGWKTVAVLVEPSKLGPLPADGIPRGEVPDIELIESRGVGARVQVAATNSPDQAQYKKSIGVRTVLALPGAFAPFGDQTLFYLVPLADDRALMVIAHKYDFNDPAHSEAHPVRTGYEEAIEAILSTLTVAKK
jgi:hypothetical protein